MEYQGLFSFLHLTKENHIYFLWVNLISIMHCTSKYKFTRRRITGTRKTIFFKIEKSPSYINSIILSYKMKETPSKMQYKSCSCTLSRVQGLTQIKVQFRLSINTTLGSFQNANKHITTLNSTLLVTFVKLL